MRYRKMDANGDMVFGGGQAAFWRDVPEAPAQAVMTRLRLQLGEWFLDTSDGTPWKTRVLGKYTAPFRDPVIRARMLGTAGVTGIAAYYSTVDSETRQFAVGATIDTVYGQATVKGVI